jgi:hypothetical protein
MNGNEGLHKAINLLKEVIIREDISKAWWVQAAAETQKRFLPARLDPA